MIPAASTSQLENEMAQWLGDTEYDVPSICGPSEDPISSYLTLLASQREPQQQLDSTGLEWDACFAPLVYPRSPHPVRDGDEERGSVLNSSPESEAGHRLSEGIEPLSRPAPTNTIQQSSKPLSHGECASTTRGRRKQNQSCDQCRSSKKACDLSALSKRTSSTGCSMCNVRGIECTAKWLANKQSVQHARKRARTMTYLPEVDNRADGSPSTCSGHWQNTTLLDSPMSISTMEVDLVKQLAARETCSLQLNLYIDVFDMPISQCLLQGSMPPRYSLGVGALLPLSNSTHVLDYFDKANRWIESCLETNFSSWASTVVAPHIFRTVSVLDSLFQRAAQANHASMPSRDASITQTYKWVAMATAAQFAVKEDERRGAGKTNSCEPLHGRDVASATWRIAKEMVFRNIAVVSSFRLALSLLLFGLIPPPNPSEKRGVFEEDTTYAFCEGVRRLQTLCTQARSCLLANEEAGSSTCSIDIGNIQRLPLDVKENVLELVGAVEWLVTIANAVAIVTSNGKVCAFAFEMESCSADIIRSTRGIFQTPDTDNMVVTQQHEQEVDNSILTRASADGSPFTTLWHSGASDDILLRALRQSGSLGILMYKALACLTMAVETVQTGKADYDKICRCYTTVTTLIGLWRSTFGTFTDPETFCSHQIRPELRSIVSFCSNDADFVVLQLYNIVQTLEIRLAEQPSTPAKERLCSSLLSTSSYRKEQRIVSAVHISSLASICNGLSTPGFQGEGGLKAQVQDIGAHPVGIAIFQFGLCLCLPATKYPSIVVQAHTLAAKAFVSEIHSSLTNRDTKRASDMTAGLETCLQALRGLEETLVMFPYLSSCKDEVFA